MDDERGIEFMTGCTSVKECVLYIPEHRFWIR